VSEETETTEPASVDTSEVSEEVNQEPGYTVKIDGQEHEVTLEELQKGYQRQADYTRKTQEVASERERLQQAEAIVSALENDPEGTLNTLAQTFGINMNPVLKEDSSWDDMDPSDKKLAELERKIEMQERAARVQQVDKEVDRLRERYGDFDKQDLLHHAVTNKITNLEAAYTHWQFNDVRSTADKLRQDKEITEKKRDAAVVAPGGSTQAGTQPEVSDTKVTTLREAFALAKKQMTT
jgi:hypothetical protein